MKKLISFPPILFSLGFVLNLFMVNISELTLHDLLVPLIITGIFAGVVTIVFSRLAKSKEKGMLFSSIFLILFFSYEDFFWQLDNYRIKLPNYFVHVNKNYIAQPLWIGLLIISFFIIRRIKNYKKIKKYVLLISIVMFANSAFQIIHYELTTGIHPIAVSSLTLPKINKKDLANFPDIYYIMPEDYSSPLVMKKYFNFDNSDFINFLTSKGFFVPSNSTSNYPKTFLSLASSLNMEYVDYLSKYNNSSDITIVAPLINNNNVLKFLKGIGYKYYQLGSWWEFTENNPEADENIALTSQNILGIDNFSCLILESTEAFPLFNSIPNLNCDGSNENKEKRLTYQFSKANPVVEMSGPKIVFMHFIAPHGPYVFGRNCEETTQKVLDGNSEENNYSNQAKCIDTKLESLINTILSKSEKPPVIILQSDEGAPFLNSMLSPIDNWTSASPDFLKEKFPILNAYYLPNAPKNLIPNSITPVNSFRIIFNLYFHTNFPILPNKNYIFQDLNHLYNFTEVTSILNTYQKK